MAVPGKKEKQPLSVTHPELAKEADGWDPNSLYAGSGKKLNWKCKFGHTWLARIVDRTKKEHGCPYCSNKRVWAGFNDLQSTYPEIAKMADGWDPNTIICGSHKKLDWKCEKGHQFKAQVKSKVNSVNLCPICSGQETKSGFNDLAVLFPLLAIQADGWDASEISPGSHKILSWKCKLGHTWKTSPKSRVQDNLGCPICSDRKILIGFNDLRTKYPTIADEADGWDASKVIHGSHTSKNWICGKGHRWKAFVNSRTRIGVGCPYCANKKVLVGFNDLQTTHPEIAQSAFGWDPKTLTAGSGINVEWICELGHKWKTKPSHRTGNKSDCPTCAPGGGFDPNDAGYLYFLNHSNWEMYQIGISNEIDRRIEKHKKSGWELLEFRGPTDGHLVQQWETAILRMLKAKGADLSNSKIAGKFDGYSEAWSKSTFEVTTIKELMKLTEEFEEQKNGN
jgi:hypothetical protein